MSTQSQFRGYARSWVGNDQHLRVSDAERSEVADRLAQHFAEGRLDQAEYDERVSRAMSAKTRADLNGLFDDLPGTGAPADSSAPAGSAAGPMYRRRRHGPLRAILLIFLVLAGISVAGHIVSSVFFWWFSPWWIILLLVILIAARATGGRSRTR